MERPGESMAAQRRGDWPEAPLARLPREGPEAQLLALQRSAGNHAVARAMQRTSRGGFPTPSSHLERLLAREYQRQGPPAPKPWVPPGMLGPLPDWSDCPNMDQVVAAWIKPRYKRYIKDRFTLETPSGNRFTPVIGDEKWWKRFEDSKMADVDVQFERRKSPVAPESLHVKVTVEAKGSTVRATLHDWSGGWESTWSWSGTLVGKRGWLLDWSQCHIVDMETPSPPKRKSPRNLLDDPAVDDDDGRETHV